MKYYTWYACKKECEQRMGRSLLNHTWLQVKPKTPLPWNEKNVRSVVAEVASTVIPRGAFISGDGTSTSLKRLGSRTTD